MALFKMPSPLGFNSLIGFALIMTSPSTILAMVKTSVSEIQAEIAGQIDPIFPDQAFTSRKLAQNKRTFTLSDRAKAELTITNTGEKPVQSADIYVNSKLIPFTAESGANIVLDIAQYAKTGQNTLSIQNIVPEGASFEVQVPYPTLTQGSPEQVGFDPQKLQKIDDLIKADLANGFSGAQLFIAKNGVIIKNSAYGYQNLYNEEGKKIKNPAFVNNNTLYDVASNTKMYATNYALMMLSYEKKLDVNKPLKDYIPEYSGDGRDQVLVKDLMMHQAGYGPEVLFFDPNNKYGLYSQDKATTEQLLLTQVPFDYGYHEKYVYSDNDYLILGILIERITGMPLDEYVESSIYKPLHLRSTLFNPLQKGKNKYNIAATEIKGNSFRNLNFPNKRTSVIRGEVHDEKAFYSMQGIAGHAGLFSTASEMGVLLQTMLNGGGYGYKRFFSQTEIDQFTKPSDNVFTIGLGWERAGINGAQKFHFGPYASNLAVGHTGWVGTMTIIDPKYDLVVVLLTNKKHSPYIPNADGTFAFTGDKFETGAYGSISALIYEAFLEN